MSDVLVAGSQAHWEGGIAGWVMIDDLSTCVSRFVQLIALDELVAILQ